MSPLKPKIGYGGRAQLMRIELKSDLEITRKLKVMIFHKTNCLNASHPFQVHLAAFKPRLKFEISASMPERHFFNMVSIF